MLRLECLEQRVVFAGDLLSAIAPECEPRNDAVFEDSDAPPPPVNVYDAVNDSMRAPYGCRLEPSVIELALDDFICTFGAHHGTRPPYDKEAVEDPVDDSEQCQGPSGEPSHEIGGSVSEVLIEDVDAAAWEPIIDDADGHIELVYTAAPASFVPLRKVMFVTYANQLPDGTWGFECGAWFIERRALPLEPPTERPPSTRPEGESSQRKTAPNTDVAPSDGDKWSTKNAAFASLTDVTAEVAGPVRGRRRVQV